MSNRYSKYPEDIQSYMNSVISDLENDYGEIPASWYISLDLLASNLYLYNSALDDIMTNGMLVRGHNNVRVKNPCVTILNNALTALHPIVKAFALNPVQRSKIKALESVDAASVVDNYVTSLTD